MHAKIVKLLLSTEQLFLSPLTTMSHMRDLVVYLKAKMYNFQKGYKRGQRRARERETGRRTGDRRDALNRGRLFSLRVNQNINDLERRRVT